MLPKRFIYFNTDSSSAVRRRKFKHLAGQHDVRKTFKRVLFAEVMQDGFSTEQNGYRAVDFTVEIWKGGCGES